MGVKLLAVVGCVLMVLLCAAPCSAETIGWLEVKDGAEFSIGSGPDCDYESATSVTVLNGKLDLLDGAVVGSMIVYDGGTVNIHQGAYVAWVIWVYGGTVNISGGQMGFGSFVQVLGGKLTVYGVDFMLQDGNGSEPYTVAGHFTPMEAYGSTLEGFYLSDIPGVPGDPIYLKFYGAVPVYLVSPAPAVEEVTIDIKPGSDTNIINLRSNGVVPVAVLTKDGFSAATIDPATVRFAGAVPVHSTLEDVDGDSDEDMLFHFRTQELDLNEESVEAALTAQLADSVTSQSAGQTGDGPTVSGTDKVRIISSKK
jgi:hypothetical protein